MFELTLVLSRDLTAASHFSSRREPSCIIHSQHEYLFSMLLLHILPSFFIRIIDDSTHSYISGKPRNCSFVLKIKEENNFQCQRNSVCNGKQVYWAGWESYNKVVLLNSSKQSIPETFSLK